MALSIQTDLNAQMRKTLLVWLLAMNRQFNFSLETWCLTVRFVDKVCKDVRDIVTGC